MGGRHLMNFFKDKRGASSALAIIVLLLGVSLIAVFWYAFNYVTLEVATPTHDMAQNWGVNSTGYEASFDFMIGFNNNMAIIALLLLVITVIVFVVRKRGE